VLLGAPRLKIVVIAVLLALILAAVFGPLTRLPGASSARSYPRRPPA
jgi:hypothetical protein